MSAYASLHRTVGRLARFYLDATTVSAADRHIPLATGPFGARHEAHRLGDRVLATRAAGTHHD
ncbi:hypothetical protein ABII15_36120 [Streptomyces sp. HUAS MG91]|uniref:Uncharacterized protein n=1 Tax=Streptomyces tabacisoli TaxID=3156398 RepID=A0AAU8J528_9ACTN